MYGNNEFENYSFVKRTIHILKNELNYYEVIGPEKVFYKIKILIIQ